MALPAHVMRTLLALGLVSASLATAAPDTLASRGLDHGGFGGPTLSVTQLRGRAALLTGGRGGWIIDHHLVLGAAIQGTPSLFGLSTSGTPGTQLWHGGALVEYLLGPDRLLHGSASLTIGAAWLRHRADGSTRFDDTVAFALEPQLGAELNVTHFFRIALTLGYRFVGAPAATDVVGSELSGFTGALHLRFGAF